MIKKITKSEKETYEFAKKYVAKLQGGEVLCLIGDLGAGKTAFTKGIAAGLGIKKIVTSPTFVLMKVYPIKSRSAGILSKAKLFNEVNKIESKVKSQKSKVMELVHIDAYRLGSGQELLNIGVGDYFSDKECVTVIEWADRVKDIWPNDCIKVEFKILKGDGREIIIK